MKSARLELPFIAPNQAQKHVTHNSALQRLDALVQATVISRELSTPPDTPEEGDCYIIPATANGIWQDQAQAITAYQDGAWVFYKPQTGWRVWVTDENNSFTFSETTWIEASSASAGLPSSITEFGINATPDSENRLALRSNASLFDYFDSGHQLKINKARLSESCSLLFQDNYNGHIEIGLTGDNNLHVRTSPEGQNFSDAMLVKSTTNSVEFPNGTDPDRLVSGTEITGGSDEALGPPNLITTSTATSNIILVRNRMYFCSFYVDRTTELRGANLAVYNTTQDPSHLIRAGVYRMGTSNGSQWSLGELMADYGSLPADTPGHKRFESADPITLSKGWYVTAVATNGDNVQVRYGRWHTPGLMQYALHGSGENSTYRLYGPSVYLFSSAPDTIIENGLPLVWDIASVNAVSSTALYSIQLLIPRWKRWER